MRSTMNGDNARDAVARKIGRGSSEGEVLVKCQHLGKRFCRDLKRSLMYGVEDIARDFLALPAAGGAGKAPDQWPSLRAKEFWAVEDVSFEVRRGECLGLIGRNGAGKTTILKVLSGLIRPDHGSVELKGQVGGLIALGAGFNPLLTGRENVYVNGSILGMSRHQISAKMEEIEAFADIGEFIDAPVQSYSSGMQVRLGFAIAAVVTKPDILLLDEVLAVGDMGFTMKCLNAVREIAADSAVIFVSHNMQWISTFCTDVMVLRNGRIHTHTSNIGEGIGAYMECYEIPLSVTGSGKAVVTNARIVSEAEPNGTAEIPQGASCELHLDIQVESAYLPSELTLYVLDQALNPVMCFPDIPHGWQPVGNGFHHGSFQIPMGKMELNAGRYSMIVLLQERSTEKYLTRVQGLAPFSIRADTVHWASVIRHA